MQTGTAPARRVGFFLADGNASVITDNTVALFDAAVSWAANTAPKVGYKRDATDRIVERSANGRIVARYSYTASGDTSDVTLDASNNVVEATISLPGGALYTWRSTTPVWSYPNTHGDITVLADTAGNKMGPTRVYDPFGRPLTQAAEIDNGAGEFDHGWLGEHQRPLEHQTGLISVIEMGARQYDPFLGRFLEVDPIEGGSCNDYEYVCGDSLNATDLDGTRRRFSRLRRWRRQDCAQGMRANNRNCRGEEPGGYNQNWKGTTTTTMRRAQPNRSFLGEYRVTLWSGKVHAFTGCTRTRTRSCGYAAFGTVGKVNARGRYTFVGFSTRVRRKYFDFRTGKQVWR